MTAWLSFVGMFFFACGESEEVSVQPEAAIMETASESVEKEIQQGGLLVRTMLTPKSLRLGDPFQLQITVEADTGVEIEMPPFGEALGRLTIADFTPKQSVANKDGRPVQVQTQKYGLQANRSGEVVIPALRIGYRLNADTDWEEILTEPIPVHVVSILPTDADLVYQNSRARLSPLPVEQPWIPWTVGIVGTGLLIGWGGWIVSRRRGKDVKVSAYEQAMEQLNQLRDEISTLTEQDSMDGIYAGLSIALRGYLEGCFDVSALEQTTEELRQSLETDLTPYRSVVLPEHIVAVLQALSLCDGVKFAAQVRTMTEVQADWNTVRDLVKTIHERSLNLVETKQTEEAVDGLV